MTFPLFHSCAFCNAPWAYSTPSKVRPSPAAHWSSWQLAQLKGKCLPPSDPDVGQLPDGAAGPTMCSPQRLLAAMFIRLILFCSQSRFKEKKYMKLKRTEDKNLLKWNKILFDANLLCFDTANFKKIKRQTCGSDLIVIAPNIRNATFYTICKENSCEEPNANQHKPAEVSNCVQTQLLGNKSSSVCKKRRKNKTKKPVGLFYLSQYFSNSMGHVLRIFETVPVIRVNTSLHAKFRRKAATEKDHIPAWQKAVQQSCEK